jgi:hypothetical protein
MGQFSKPQTGSEANLLKFAGIRDDNENFVGWSHIHVIAP